MDGYVSVHMYASCMDVCMCVRTCAGISSDTGIVRRREQSHWHSLFRVQSCLQSIIIPRYTQGKPAVLSGSSVRRLRRTGAANKTGQLELKVWGGGSQFWLARARCPEVKPFMVDGAVSR